MSHAMRKLGDDVVEALKEAGDRFASSMHTRSRRQRQTLLDIVQETRERDRVLAHQQRGHHVDRPNVDRPNAHVDADGVRTPDVDVRRPASFGHADSNDYRGNFFGENPSADPSDWVHHAVEQNTMRNYPDAGITPGQMNSPENLRGIPDGINRDVHLSAIRKMWNQFYAHYERLGHPPTKAEMLDYATLIDDAFGDLFDPPVR